MNKVCRLCCTCVSMFDQRCCLLITVGVVPRGPDKGLGWGAGRGLVCIRHFICFGGWGVRIGSSVAASLLSVEKLLCQERERVRRPVSTPRWDIWLSFLRYTVNCWKLTAQILSFDTHDYFQQPYPTLIWFVSFKIKEKMKVTSDRLLQAFSVMFFRNATKTKFSNQLIKWWQHQFYWLIQTFFKTTHDAQYPGAVYAFRWCQTATRNHFHEGEFEGKALKERI